MTDAPAITRKTDRRHRAKAGPGQFVTDQELIEWLGIPADIGRQALHALDRNRASNFPKKQPFWGDRRYFPAVQKWLESGYGFKIDDLKRRAS